MGLTRKERAKLDDINRARVRDGKKQMTEVAYEQRLRAGKRRESEDALSGGTGSAVDGFRAGAARNDQVRPEPEPLATVPTDEADPNPLTLTEWPHAPEPMTPREAGEKLAREPEPKAAETSDEANELDGPTVIPDRRSIRAATQGVAILCSALGEPMSREERELTDLTNEATHEAMNWRRIPTPLLWGITGVAVIGRRVFAAIMGWMDDDKMDGKGAVGAGNGTAPASGQPGVGDSGGDGPRR